MIPQVTNPHMDQSLVVGYDVKVYNSQQGAALSNASLTLIL